LFCEPEEPLNLAPIANVVVVALAVPELLLSAFNGTTAPLRYIIGSLEAASSLYVTAT